MRNNILLCFTAILSFTRLTQCGVTDDYITYRMGEASSQMDWVDNYGFLSFPDYWTKDSISDSQADCNLGISAFLSGNFLLCRSQNFSTCISEITLSIKNNSMANSENLDYYSSVLHYNVTRLSLDEFSLEDATKYIDQFKNIKSLSICVDKVINWEKTEELLLKINNLFSLKLKACSENLYNPTKIKPVKDFLKTLQYLYLSGCYKSSELSWLKYTKLKYLNLQNLNNLAQDFFNYLPETVQTIDFGKPIYYFEDLIYRLETLSHLPIKMLGLARLNLTLVPQSFLNISEKLQYLSLHGNKFGESFLRGLSYQVFQFLILPELLELDLRYCGLRMLPEAIFDQLPRLKKISLAFNKLVFQAYPNFNFNSLEYIDISMSNQLDEDYTNVIEHKQIEVKTFKIYASNPVFVDVSYSNSFKNATSLIPINTTHLTLSQTSIDSCGLVMNYSSMEVLYLNNIQIKSNCIHEITENILKAKNLKELYIISNYLFGAEIANFIRIFDQLHILVLKGNKIDSINEQQMTSLTNLELLDLSYNSIITWKKRIFNENHKISELNISSNKLTMITSQMLLDFKNIQKLDISKNPLICNNYLQLLILSHKQSNYQLLYSEDNFCLSDGRYLNYNEFLASTQTSSDAYSAYCYVIIITISLAISVCAVIIYKKWHAISYYVKLVKISKGQILFNLNRKSTKHFQYDVFISYSENDRAWVLEQLLPQLERNGTSICLHERDFQVGMSILENIMESMNRSRCLLLVISKSFIKSRWCQFEMNLAQFLLVEMRDRHIILAFLENIEKTDRPKLLHYLMSTKTYIEWPPENGNKFNEESSRFYRRLNLALQHNHSKE